MRVLLALAALLVAVPLGSATPRSRTLVVAGGPITAFAQNGRFLAWASLEPQNARCPMLVRIRDLERGYQKAVTHARGETCRSDLLVSRLALALSLDGRRREARALWLRFEAGNNQYWYLSTGTLRSGRERRVAELVYSSGDDVRVSLFGDGPLLGYAWSDAGLVEEHGCLDGNGPPCPFRIKDGGEVRAGIAADSLQARPVPAAGAAASGERGYGRLAIAVRGVPGAETEAGVPVHEIEVRSPSFYGARISRFATKRPVRALAVSSNTVAVLTDRAIERYTIGGTLRAVDPVPATTSRQLSISNHGVVYSVGRSIRALGRGQLALAASAPIGLSIDGRRVAWAENVRIGGRLRGRVRALELP